MIVDYFSRYSEVYKLTTTTSKNILISLKTAFSRHGIPDTLRTDNGPQFSLIEFAEFAQQYDFTHNISSLHFPASNGQAERTVQTIKQLLKNADDYRIALLSYRATPFPWCGKSPAEFSMGRKIRTLLPQTTASLVPQWHYLLEFKTANKKFKDQQKNYYDVRHIEFIACLTSLTIQMFGLLPMDKTLQVEPSEGQMLPDPKLSQLPQASCVEIVNVNPSTATETRQPSDACSPVMKRSCTGTIINPPDRLQYN